MHNLMTLVFWTGVWIVGSAWLDADGQPLAADQPLDRAGPHCADASLAGPVEHWAVRFGHLPAVLGYAGFVWFQMVSLYPDDPAVLAKVALAYWLVIFRPCRLPKARTGWSGASF